MAEPTETNPQRPQPRPPFEEQQLAKPGLESELSPRPRYQAPAYRPAGKLEGRCALVTGGDSGIGRAVAVIYAREGADVAITHLPAERSDAEETRRVIEEYGRRCLVIEADLTSPQACAGAVERTVRELGRLDVLVSNAAYQNRKHSLDEMTTEEWERTFRTNIDPYFHLVKAAVPHLRPGSAIIATSSVQGFVPSRSLPDYAATKGAINQLTKALAQMLVGKGIRVNAVAPGPVWTPLNPADEGATEEKVAEFGASVPMGRPAQPEEIAPAFVFLASEADSSYVTGIVLPELGGEVIGG